MRISFTSEECTWLNRVAAQVLSFNHEPALAKLRYKLQGSPLWVNLNKQEREFIKQSASYLVFRSMETGTRASKLDLVKAIYEKVTQ